VSEELYIYTQRYCNSNKRLVHLWVPSFSTKYSSVTSTNHNLPHTLFSMSFCMWGRSFPRNIFLGKGSQSHASMHPFFYMWGQGFPRKAFLGKSSQSKAATPHLSVYKGPSLTDVCFPMKISSLIRRKQTPRKFSRRV